jgi:hypothetical protein
MKLTPEESIIYTMIDEILWNDWDPIDVHDIGGIRVEYQSYTPQVFYLKMTNADPEKIALHLFQIETERMGLSGSIDHCRKVAEKISNLSV